VSIGRLTIVGAFSQFPVKPGTAPWGIVSGPDGALWFSESSTILAPDKIGRITTAGVITDFPVITSPSLPQLITAGPDGALWFTETNANKIGRITTAGAVSELAIPTANSQPFGIAAGPDGNIWFAEGNAKQHRPDWPAFLPASSGRTGAFESGLGLAGVPTGRNRHAISAPPSRFPAGLSGTCTKPPLSGTSGGMDWTHTPDRYQTITRTRRNGCPGTTVKPWRMAFFELITKVKMAREQTRQSSSTS
jgi:hypothetical protein